MIAGLPPALVSQVNTVSSKATQTLETSVFENIIETGKVKARERLAMQLAALACDQNAPVGERQAIIPVMLRLASDPVASVRKMLAVSLTGCSMLHPDVLFSIVADDEEISLPFLAATPSLDAKRALAILKVGDDARRVIIAARADIGADAIAWICESATEAVCSCLLDNQAAHIPADDYRKLYMRFRNAPEIVERLLARHDLPLEVRILQARRAAGNVQRLVTERGWIAANDAEEIIADAKEGTMLKILRAAKMEDLPRLVAFVCNKSMMTPALLLRAGISGDMKVVEHALAFLSATSLQKVHKIIASCHVAGLKSVCSKAGLPGDAFFVLRAACDVALQEGRSATAPFGVRLVENLATRYSSLALDDRTRLLGILARLGDDMVSSLAQRLSGELRQAA